MWELYWIVCLFLAGTAYGEHNCLIATDVNSASVFLGLNNTDGSVTKDAIAEKVFETYTGESLSTLKSFEYEKLYGIVSILVLLENDTDTYWRTANFDVLRVYVEQISISHNTDKKSYFETFIGFLTLQEVILLACGEEYWFAENDASEQIGFSSGCYDNVTFEADFTVSNSNPISCIAECRKQGYLLVGSPSATTCSCASKSTALGTYVSNAATCSPPSVRVWKTGMGNPKEFYPDPSNFGTLVFDPKTIDGVDIAHNELRGVKPIVFPGKEQDPHFIALYTFSVVLFKMKRSDQGADFYEYVGHKRWDADNAVDGNQNWIMAFEPAADIFTFPNKSAVDLGEATAFDVVPIFITLNDTMQTESPIDYQNPASIMNATNLAALPYPGGRYYSHIVIFHSDDYFFYSRPAVQATVIRLEESGLHQLITTKADEDFGSFKANDAPSKYPVAVTQHLVARRSFLFVASSNENMGQTYSRISLFEFSEEFIPLSQFAGYGRIVMDQKNSMDVGLVDGIELVENLFNFLLVLDRSGSNSRIRVFKIENYINFKETDTMTMDQRYTSLKFVKVRGEGYVLLSSAAKSVLVPVSRKGQLSEVSITFAAEVIPVVYGNLEENSIFPSIQKNSNTVFQVFNENGELLPGQITVNDTAAVDLSMVCFPGDFRILCNLFEKLAVSIDLVSIDPFHRIQVDNSLTKHSEWTALKYNIDQKVTLLSGIYAEQVSKKQQILMNANNSVVGDWSIQKLVVSDRLQMPENSLDGSVVNMASIVGGSSSAVTYNGGSDFRQGMNILLGEVQSRLEEIETGLDSLDLRLNNALNVSLAEEQTLQSVLIENLSSDDIIITGDNLYVENLKGTATESLDSLEADLAFKGSNITLKDTKTLVGRMQTSSLSTTFLSNNISTISPQSCLLTSGNQSIPVHITLSNPVEMTNLYVGESLPLTNSYSNASVFTADLDPSSISDLGGFYLFLDKVTTGSVQADMTTGGITLSVADEERIVKKDEADIINGTLEINMPEGSNAVGVYVNVKNAVVNGMNLMDLADNVVYKDCESCTSMDVSINEKITFTGKVEVIDSLSVDKINDVNFENYIKMVDFLGTSSNIAGEKIIHNEVAVDSATAETFNNLTLDQILTRTTEQNVTGLTVFQNSTSFTSISGVSESDVPEIDGTDFLHLFRTDLVNLEAQKSWMASKEIVVPVKFTELHIQASTNLSLMGNINNIDVPSNLDRIVLKTDSAISFTDTKTFESSVTFNNDVSNARILKENSTYTIDSFVNTVNTSTIDGEKKFAGNVTFEDLFMVGSSKVNGEDFSKILQCWVDVGTNETTSVDILHPIKFEKIVAPRLIVAKAISSSSCSPPNNITLEEAAVFVGVPSNQVDGALPDDISQMIRDKLLEVGYTVPTDIQGDDLALDAIFSYLLIIKDSTLFVDSATLVEKREALNLLIRRTYRVSSTRAASLTDLEAVQLLCRDPVINDVDPSIDLALLDAENVFCSPDNACIQKFNSGFLANTLDAKENVHMNVNATVFGVDLSVLDQERTSLTSSNIMEGTYYFNDMSLDEVEGVFNGLLLIEFENQTIYSNNYKPKFLDVQSTATQQFTVDKTVAAVDITNIRADTFKVNDTEYDIPTLLSSALKLNESVMLTNIEFMGPVTVSGDVGVVGTVDGINVRDLAKDVVILGADEVVDDSLTIIGSYRSSIQFSGEKILSSAPQANSLEALLDSGALYPNFLYFPCTVDQTLEGVLMADSADITVTTVSDLDECHEACRLKTCRAVSYNDVTSECKVFTGYISLDTTATAFTTYLYTCWMQLQSNQTGLFLAMDRATNTLVTSTDPDGWLFEDGKLVNHATRLAVTITADHVVGDPVSLLPVITPASSDQLIIYTEGAEFQIKSQSRELWLSETDANTVVLQSTGSSWVAGMGGVKFDKLVGGVPQTRMMTKHTDQTVTASLEIKGTTNITGDVDSDSLAGVTVSEIEAEYTYNSNSNLHEIKGDLYMGNQLDINNLYSANLGGRNFATFMADVINKTSSASVSISATKVFADLKTGASTVSVSGNVTGYDINDEHAETAFIDPAYSTRNVFTQPNTFIEGDNVVTAEIELTSLTELNIQNPQIQNGENLADLFDSSIRKDVNENITVLGTVLFDESVISEDDVNLGSLSGGIEASFLLEDIVLKTDSVLNLTVNGVTRKFSVIDAVNIDAFGQLFGYDPEETLDIFFKDGNQTIYGPVNFTDKIQIVQDAVISGNFNGYKLPVAAVILGDNTTMLGQFEFAGTFTVQSLQVNGLIDSLDFDTMALNIFTTDGNQTIAEKWHFKSLTEFEKKIVGVAATGDELINQQRVADLLAVDSIYEKVQAVKVSAQAEAATLCEYVDALQLSYQGNQGIDKYELYASKSDVGADYSDSLVYQLESGTGLVTINGNKVAFWSVAANTLTQLAQFEDHTGTDKLRIDGTILVSGTSYNRIVFVSTSKPDVGVNSGVYMYRITVSGGSVSVQQAGKLLVNTIAVLDDSRVVALEYFWNTYYYPKLKLLAVEELSSCGTSCSAVTLTEIYDGLSQGDFWSAIPSPAEPRIDAVYYQDQSQFIVAMAVRRDGFVQDMANVVHFEPVYSGGVASYNLIAQFAVGVQCSNFALLNVNEKTYLLSAKKFLESMLINTRQGTVGDVVVESVEGPLDKLRRYHNFDGRCQLMVVQNGARLLFLEFAGLDGLRVSREIDATHFMASSSSVIFTENGQSKNCLLYAGGEDITLLDGVLKNPASQVDFSCPAPEISNLLLPPTP